MQPSPGGSPDAEPDPPIPEDDPSTQPERETRGQLRGSGLLLIGRLLSVGVNLVTQILIVRYLPRSDYGAFAYALSLVTLIGGLLGLGFDRAISRFLPMYDEQSDHAKFLGTIVLVFGVIIGLGATVSLVVIGLQGALIGQFVDDPQAVRIVVLMVALAPIEALDGVLTDFFAVFRSARTIFVRKYILAPGLRLAVVALLILSGSDVDFLAAGYVLAGAVGILLYATLLPGMLREARVLEHLRGGRIRIPLREIASYTVPLLTIDLVLLSMSSLDALLVGNIHGTNEVAALRVVESTARLNSLVFTTFSILFVPAAARFFTRGDRSSMRDLYWRTAAWMAVLSFPVFALTFSLAEPLTVTLFGERYASSGTILALLSLGRYIDSAFGANGTTIRIFGGIREIVVVNVVTAVGHLALALLLIPPFGALGAALAILFTYMGYNLLKQYVLQRVTGMPMFERAYLSTYAAIILAAAAIAILQVAADPPFVVAIVVAGVGSFAVLAFGRRHLRLAETFPELLRFPGGRFLR